ncbi:MAG: hypothetical protein ACLR4Z_14325 [Butyricicoccaceae bacterium]
MSGVGSSNSSVSRPMYSGFMRESLGGLDGVLLGELERAGDRRCR